MTSIVTKPTFSQIKVSFYLNPHQHLLSFFFLMMAILTGLGCNLKVILICLVLMDKAFEHFKNIYWQIVYLKNCMFSSLTLPFIGSFVFIMLSSSSSLVYIFTPRVKYIGKDFFSHSFRRAQETLAPMILYHICDL